MIPPLIVYRDNFLGKRRLSLFLFAQINSAMWQKGELEVMIRAYDGKYSKGIGEILGLYEFSAYAEASNGMYQQPAGLDSGSADRRR